MRVKLNNDAQREWKENKKKSQQKHYKKPSIYFFLNK